MLLHLMSCCIDTGQNSIPIPLEFKLADFKLHIFVVRYGKTSHSEPAVTATDLKCETYSTDKFSVLRAD